MSKRPLTVKAEEYERLNREAAEIIMRDPQYAPGSAMRLYAEAVLSKQDKEKHK